MGEEYILVYSSEGWGPSWQGGMTAHDRYGARNGKLREHIFDHEHKAKRMNWKWTRLYNLKAASSDTLPPARAPLLTFPKQCHQLGSKCSNTGDSSHSNYKSVTFHFKKMFHFLEMS